MIASAPQAPATLPEPTSMAVWVQVKVPVDKGCAICRKSGLCVCVFAGNDTVH
ncbi:MAG: hypothetical protein Q8R92_19780 [Deltaproteobacteria bacterium]|nr:hypothetical protein [Deltaproteobacteria bacterium]